MSALPPILPNSTPPQTIEPTVNYIHNDGAEIFNYTGGPGSTEVKTGGNPDPHKVVMHNARPHLGEFKLDVHGFRFVAPRHQDAELLRRGRDQARLLSGDGGAGESRERRQARRGVRPHAAHRRRRGRAKQRKIREVVRRVHNDYTEWSGPQRVRDILPDEAEELLQAPLRHHPGVAADPLSGRDPSARHLRCAQRRARRSACCRSAAIPTASARPTRSPTIRRTVVLVPAPCARRGAGVQGLRFARRTAAPAGPPTPPSTIRPRRPTRGRARASRSARWRFSERVLSISRPQWTRG